MKPSEFVLNTKISNRDKFGAYLKSRRTALGLGLREFADKLSLSPAYISDIEKGNRHAPSSHLEKVADILAVEKEEINSFYDLAGCSQSNWQDINEYLAQNPNARKAIRLARDKNMSGEEFLEIVENFESSKTTKPKEREK